MQTRSEIFMLSILSPSIPSVNPVTLPSDSRAAHGRDATAPHSASDKFRMPFQRLAQENPVAAILEQRFFRMDRFMTQIRQRCPFSPPAARFIFFLAFYGGNEDCSRHFRHFVSIN